MELTEQEAAEAIMTSAAELAEKLGLHREENIPNITTDTYVLVASPRGINFGKPTNSFGEMRTYKYDNYYLNGAALYTKHYGSTGYGWEAEATTRIHLDEDAIVYVG